MKRHSHRAFPRRQRGTMLIISLIVLVAMTLAGIATMRSVDTASLVAGNIGFRQSTLNAADQGVQPAVTWLKANMNTGTVNADQNATTNSLGYFASVAPGNDIDWTNNANWLNAALVNGGTPDAGRNVVAYRIDRMCACAGNPGGTCPSGVTNICASTPTNLGLPGGEGVSMTGLSTFVGTTAIHYRVTVRSLGPRGSVAYVQAMLRSF